eukprot:g16570.t1
MISELSHESPSLHSLHTTPSSRAGDQSQSVKSVDISVAGAGWERTLSEHSRRWEGQGELREVGEGGIDGGIWK